MLEEMTGVGDRWGIPKLGSLYNICRRSESRENLEWRRKQKGVTEIEHAS